MFLIKVVIFCLPEQKMFLQHWTLQLKFPHFPLDFEDMRGFLVHFVHVQPLPRVPGEQGKSKSQARQTVQEPVKEQDDL